MHQSHRHSAQTRSLRSQLLYTQNIIHVASPVKAGRAATAHKQQQQHSSTATAALRTDVAAPPTKDVTASIMRAAMQLSLKNRLRQYQSVEADVSCDAAGLLDGRFDALSIEGRHWVTPLNMTAHKLEVDIGAMQVDYSVLMWQQKVQMKNIPVGRVQIHLSGKDMGNFVSHPLFRVAAMSAVHGHPFHFDKDSVQINHSQNAVTFTGTWGLNGERYKVLMIPGKQLQVGAQHISSEDGQPTAEQHGSQQVASGMANFFSNLALDLQGIEIRNPVLSLHPGDTSDSQEGDLLEIGMKLRLRAFPPLDMQF